MTTLKETLKEDMMTALRQKDTAKLSILRYVLGEVQTAELTGKTPVEFTDEQVLEKIAGVAKKMKENVALYTETGETAHAENAQAELNLLSAYLPAQMGEEEVKAIVATVIAEAGENPHMGLIMKGVMQSVKGKADGQLVKRIVQEELQK